MKPLGRITALALVVAAGLPLAGAHAAPEPVPTPTPSPTESSAPVTWGIVPSGPNGPGERAAFEYTLDPGAVVTDVVAISNYTEQPLTLDVYASDVVRNTSGGFDLLPATDEPIDLGAWVDLGDPTVTIPARSRIDVPFRITVPANATPGDHAGGIVASMTAPAGTGEGQVSVDRRVGARIYLRVTGTLDPALSVDDVHAGFSGLPLGQPGTVTVDYTVHNDGNLRLIGRPTVRVAGPFGLGKRHQTGDQLPELLPGDSFTTSMTIDGIWQLGPLGVDIEIQPETSGDQTLDPAPAPTVTTLTLWVVPWIALAILAALIAGISWRRRRRRRRQATTPVASSDPDTSAPAPGPVDEISPLSPAPPS